MTNYLIGPMRPKIQTKKEPNFIEKTDLKTDIPKKTQTQEKHQYITDIRLAGAND
jgi:hypothetical protein